MSKVKDEIKELGFHDSYYSEGFKEGIPTRFIDAISEPEYRWHIKIERSE